MTVDEALATAIQAKLVHDGVMGARVNSLDMLEATVALAAEVRRLRSECDLRRDEHLNACRKIDRLNDKLARVEKALNRLWYDVRDPIAENVPGHPEPVGLQVFEMYDEALRDALKGD